MNPFFGELYLRSTRPFLPDAVSDAEGEFLRRELPTTGLVLDLGCGHGRHLARLVDRQMLGVDGDALSLAEAHRVAPVARADFSALPFRDGAFAGAYSWYNTLGTFEPEVTQAFLRELARCLRPDGLFIVQASHPQRAQQEPTAQYDGFLPDGSHLQEDCRYDEAQRRDWITRHLRLPDGRVMAASFFIRYYDLDEWRSRLAEVGLSLAWAYGGIEGQPVTSTSAELVLGARKRV